MTKASALWRRRSRALAVLGLFFLISACGYRFTSGASDRATGGKNIYVDVFSNNTATANIETAFRNAFIDQFIKGRNFKIVNTRAGADLFLKGDIKNLVITPLAYRGDSLAVEKRITVTLVLTLEGREAKKIIWRAENFSHWGDFTIDGNNILAGQINQKNALTKLANDLAERAYRMMVTDF